jgi:hypothetical protein
MSTTKNCPKTNKKQTPPPEPFPVFAKVPCPRDQQAYGLHLEGHSQRWIAGKLKCAQPTVMRGIRRMEKWLTTLPEDRGEYTASEKLRLAMAKHERLMERLIKMSLREFRRSRKTIPMKKTITMKDGVDEKGEPVKIRIEEWNKPQIGRKGFIDAAAKASHEITVLAAGWLGPGCGSISMAEVMDPKERDRWDRIVTTQDAQIKELEERAKELEGRSSTPREESAQRPTPPVSQVAEKEHSVNQKTAHQVVVTSGRPTASATRADTSPRQEQERKTCITDPPLIGIEQPPVLARPCEAEPRGRGFPG